MPYILPSTKPLTTTTASSPLPTSPPSLSPTSPLSTGRPGHRRSFSTFPDERGPGAFAPLPSLPRRTSSSSSTTTTTTTTRSKPPVFHFRNDDDSDSSSDELAEHHFHTVNGGHIRLTPTTPRKDNDEDDDEDDRPTLLPPVKIKPSMTFGLTLKTPPLKPSAIPFPRSSPPVSPSPRTTLGPSNLAPARATTPTRTSSNPILLSSGKPLKSSLKSSSSTGSIPSLPLHTRARSAPAMPKADFLSSSNSSASPSPAPAPLTPKNVHFPSLSSDLERVMLFNRSGRPASLSTPGLGDETETETEGESSAAEKSRYFPGSFPFPRMAVAAPSPLSAGATSVHPSGSAGAETVKFHLDATCCSQVPSPHRHPYANVHLESVELNSTPSTTTTIVNGVHHPTLSGTLLVRNVAYEKQVFVRFTLDDWQTTSEVTAKYSSSLSELPVSLLPRTLGDLIASSSSSLSSGDSSDGGKDEAGWDRFGFSIRLEDYITSLEKRTMWMVVRYASPGVGEWWDNNGGSNYKMEFRREKAPVQVKERERSVSAPAVTMTQPTLAPPVETLPTPTVMPPSSPTTSSSPTLNRSPELQHALSLATTQRLARFSLKNYAAPGGVRVVTTPPSVSPENSAPVSPSVERKGTAIAGGAFVDTEKGKSKEKEGGGVLQDRKQEGLGLVLDKEGNGQGGPAREAEEGRVKVKDVIDGPISGFTKNDDVPTAAAALTADHGTTGNVKPKTSFGKGITLYWPFSSGNGGKSASVVNPAVFPSANDQVGVGGADEDVEGMLSPLVTRDSPTPTTGTFFDKVGKAEHRGSPLPFGREREKEFYYERRPSPPPAGRVPELERSGSTSSTSSMGVDTESEEEEEGDGGVKEEETSTSTEQGYQWRKVFAEKTPPSSGSSRSGSPGTPVPAMARLSPPVWGGSGSGSPLTSPLTPTSPGLKGPEGDELYKAFVRQWCFATGGPSSATSSLRGDGNGRGGGGGLGGVGEMGIGIGGGLGLGIEA